MEPAWAAMFKFYKCVIVYCLRILFRSLSVKSDKVVSVFMSEVPGGPGCPTEA